MVPRLKTGFSNYNNNDLLVLAENVVYQITENAGMFDQAVLDQKEKVKPISVQFAIMIDKAKTRATLEIDKRNDCRLLLIRQLTLLADLINSKYRTNMAALDASGFVVLKIKKKLELSPITNIQLSQSKTHGRIKLKIIGAKNHKSIELFYATKEELEKNMWSKEMLSIKTWEIGDFEQGTIIYVKAIAYGIDNSFETSQIYSIAVQ
ncbi:MAG: hypothetical protein N4A49_07610 [Marinifilaceae bacterium]|nr:hypothetical protein [Marinifilaceae bacterium]